MKPQDTSEFSSRLPAAPPPHARTSHFLTCVSFLLLGLSAAAIAGAQAKNPQVSSFAGTWKATFHGKTWLELTLARPGSTLKGTLSHSILVAADDQGEITNVSDEMGESKIVSAELEDGVLSFRAEDSEGLVDRYQMTLTGVDSADLRSVTEEGSDSGRKPVKLTRSAANP